MREKIKNIPQKIQTFFTTYLGRSKNVYFISGMCYNCSVFDNISLPKGFEKHYIEWEIPLEDESLEAYAYRISKNINVKKPFFLVGYSFGGILAQEIAKHTKPRKIILISSIKKEEEIPHIFQVAKKVNFADNVPKRMYNSSDFMISLFNRYIYKMPANMLEGFMTVTDPTYLHWSLKEITNWLPNGNEDVRTYHIHGTKDQVFPYIQIINPITVRGGDHLMIVKRDKQINEIINTILLEE